MNPVKILLVLLVLYLIGFTGHAMLLHKTVYGDGIYYYSWLPTLADDRDTDFTNQYSEAGVTQPTAKSGKPANKYSIAPGVFWMPAYLSVKPVFRGSGFEFPYQFTIGLVGVLSAWTGILLLYRLLLYLGYSTMISVSSAACVALATNLLFYGSLDTVNSHALSFLVGAVFLTLISAKQIQWTAAGVLAGIAMLIRPQDIILAVPALFFIKNLHEAAAFVKPILLMMIFQLAVLYSVYGTVIISPYLSSIEGFSPFTPHMFGVLFSARSGLFLWTPAVAIGVFGLIAERKHSLMKALFITFALQLYVVSAWSVWWQGESYSGRMFVSVLPAITLGIAVVLKKLTKLRFRYRELMCAIVIPLGLINAVSIVYFLLIVQR